MERRQFVFATVLGFFSANNLIASTLIHDENRENLIDLLGGMRLSSAYQNDQILQKAVRVKSSNFVELGYEIDPNPQHISLKNGNKLFFYWLVLKHQDLGVLEKTLLTFEKGQNGKLNFLPPINGEVVNALSDVARELSLSSSNDELLDLLIPCQDEQAKQCYFTTAVGKIYFKDVRKDNKSTCDIKIYKGDTVVLAKSVIRRKQSNLIS